MKKSLCMLAIIFVNSGYLSGDEAINHIRSGDFEKSTTGWKKATSSKIIPQTLGGNIKDISIPNKILSISMDKNKIKIMSQKIKVDLNTKVVYLSFKYKKDINYKSLNPAGLYNVRFKRKDNSSTFYTRNSNIPNNRWGYEIIEFTKITGKKKSKKIHELTVFLEFFEAEGKMFIDDVVLEAYPSGSKEILKQKQKKLANEVLKWNNILEQNAPLDINSQTTNNEETTPKVNLAKNGDFSKGKLSWKSNVKVTTNTEDENKHVILHLKKVKDGVTFSQKINFGNAKVLEISFKSKSNKKNQGSVKCWREKRNYTYYKFSTGVNEWKTTTIKYSGMERKRSITLEFSFPGKDGTISLDDITVFSVTN